MSSSSKKSSKPFSRNAGDWMCPDKSCGNLNFARRDCCNRCETAKPNSDSKKTSEIGHAAAKNSRGLFSADDWSCLKCGNINWARRTTCNICQNKKFADDQRTGYGGGYNERGVVEYKERQSSDSEYDEFGRRKKKSSKSDSSKRSRGRSRSRSRSRSSDSSSSSSSMERRRRKRSRKSPQKRSRRSSSSSSSSERDSPRHRSPPPSNKNSKDAQKDRRSSSSSSSSSRSTIKSIKKKENDDDDSESDEDLSKYNLFDDDLDVETFKKEKRTP